MDDAPSTAPDSFRGLRVGVVGLGVEGLDAVRFLQQEGAAEIVVSDLRPEEALRDRVQQPQGIDFELQSGGNDPALAERVDALIVSQGVPRDAPLLLAATERGLPVSAMMQLFLRRCPVPVIGISGSAGKTTTTVLVGAMFEAAQRPVFVGGNIGRGLLGELHTIRPEMTAVVEISHTQLLRTERSPQIAALLNVTPNHLDQFGWDEYVELKGNLLRYQEADDWAVLPSDEPVARGLGEASPARRAWFGLADVDAPGASVVDGQISWIDGRPEALLPAATVRLRGEHNLRNVLAAVAIGAVAELPPAAMAEAIRVFRGVAHRIEAVGEAGGLLFINDSIATAPERTVAALRALEQPVVLLLGGRDKQLPLDVLARQALNGVRAIVCFGESAAEFADGLRAEWGDEVAAPPVAQRSDLEAAFAHAVKLGEPGDAVLLAPAATSFDAYENFAQRGEHFRRLVATLGGGDGAGDGGGDDGAR